MAHEIDTNAKNVLDAGEQAALSAEKVELRIQNEKYLRQHPEVDQLMNNFLHEVLVEKPKDPLKYAVAYFTSPELKANLAKTKAFEPERP